MAHGCHSILMYFSSGIVYRRNIGQKLYTEYCVYTLARRWHLPVMYLSKTQTMACLIMLHLISGIVFRRRYWQMGHMGYC